MRPIQVFVTAVVFLFSSPVLTQPLSLPGTEEAPKPAPPPPPNCKVSEFRSLTEEPESRRLQAALNWLKGPGKDCSIDRLILLRNNRNAWMGTVDSPVLAGALDALIEEKAKDDPGVIQGLYTSPVPPTKQPQ